MINGPVQANFQIVGDIVEEELFWFLSMKLFYSETCDGPIKHKPKQPEALMHR